MIYGICAAIAVGGFSLGARALVRLARNSAVRARVHKIPPGSSSLRSPLGMTGNSRDRGRWDKWIPVSQAKYERGLPFTLDLIVRSLYSGAGFVQALREAAKAASSPSGTDLRRVVQEIDLGEPVELALIHWRDRTRYESVVVCVAAITLALEVGGNQAVAVDTAAAAVRRTLEAAATAKTNATQSRASAAALVLMPLVVSGPLILFNSDARQFMLHTFVGFSLLAVGLALDVLGWFWMQSMVKRALS